MNNRKNPDVRFKVKTQSLKFLVFSFMFCLFSHFALTCFAQDKIIAIVNKDVITQKDLDDFVSFMRMQLSPGLKGGDLERKIQSIKSDLLDRLIEDRLILQEAKKKIEIRPNVWISMEPDENKVKARIDEIKKRYPTEVEFQRALSQQGLTQADIELKIKEQLLMYNIIEYKIRRKIVVNPTEVTDFYHNNSQRFKDPELREVTSIVIDDSKLSSEIFDNLKGGSDLANIANKYSLSLDRFRVRSDGELREDIEDAVSKLNIGEVSKPLQINGKFYIFRLDKIIPNRQKNLLEVQEQIYTFLFDKKMQEELTRWLDELKTKSYIKIL